MVAPGASVYAESGLQCAFMEGASRADHEPHPFALRSLSLPRLPPPRDASVSAVLAGARGAGRGAFAGLRAKPERGGICLRAWYLAGPSQPFSAPRDSCRRQGQAPGTQPQGCCPRFPDSSLVGPSQARE